MIFGAREVFSKSNFVFQLPQTGSEGTVSGVLVMEYVIMRTLVGSGSGISEELRPDVVCTPGFILALIFVPPGSFIKNKKNRLF